MGDANLDFLVRGFIDHPTPPPPQMSAWNICSVGAFNLLDPKYAPFQSKQKEN